MVYERCDGNVILYLKQIKIITEKSVADIIF